jgi:nucleotide-binding universal stress UspA family protein
MTMSLPRGALPDRPDDESPPDPVVALGSRVPDWLRQWCLTSGREIDVRPEPTHGTWAPQSTAALTREVSRLTGTTVWIPRDHDHDHGWPSRVAAAVRDLPGDDRVLAEAAAASAYLGATLLILHAVPVSFAERSVGLDAAVDHGRQVLARAAANAADRLPDGCVTVSKLVRAYPHELVGEALDADLLVMGGPRPGVGMASGLVLRTALHHAPCPVLLAPRARDDA